MQRKMQIKRHTGRVVHWAPSSEVIFVRPQTPKSQPAMKMEAASVGDEVRFATSPDIIADGKDARTANTYHPDFVHTRSPRERRLRVQVAMNKHGFIELNLSNLDLRSIPLETFNFTRIEVLNVSKNKLSTIPTSIAHLRKLRILDAHHNHIQTLPDTISNCSHLQEVDLSNNRLASLPLQFNALRYLRVLRIGHNQFENIPHELGDLHSLRQLELPGNKLWHLPGTIANLHSLHLLNLGHNKFEQLPISVCQLRHLEALDLRGNQLLSLPPDCDNWKYLKELNVSSNRLETMPPCISNLKNLQSLDLSHNKLKVLPPRLARLPKLRVLMVCDNQLTLVPNHLETLEYLNLADNRLKNFSVSKMRMLKYLNVNHNALENLPLGICNLSELEVVKLNTNRISYISQDIILLKNLRILDVGHNRLTSLPHVINELEKLETFNVQGNRLDPRQHYLQRSMRDIPYIQQQQSMYPAQMIRQEHARSRRHETHPPPASRRSKSVEMGSRSDPEDGRNKNNPASAGKTKKTKSTQYMPHSRATGTQYTPKSSARVRERPPLDYVPNSLSPPSYPHSKAGANSEKTEKATEAASTAHKSSVARDLTEVSYPQESVVDKENIKVPPSTRSVNDKVVHASSNGHVSMLTQNWLDERKQARHSVRSNAATVNGSVGDELSLGDEDYEYQPTTVKDKRLLDVCREVEAMLNKQMMQPWIKPTGIFRKSLNERGTIRMLNGLQAEKARMYEVNPEPSSIMSAPNTIIATPLGRIHMTEDQYLQRPLEAGNTNVLLRTKADQFDVTPAGGLFKSSADPNISIYFPVKAVDLPMAVTLQVEKIDQEALLDIKRLDPIVNNILALGHIVHVTQSHNVDFNEQVTLTVPAPPAPKRGRIHILTYHEDNTCSPCTSPYKVYQGYISLQAWHFSGKGAVLTKSKCKYKACKSVEQLLSKLYI